MKCPVCGRYFDKKQKCIDHMNSSHGEEIEKSGMDACQTLYFSTHGTIKGKCMCGCERDTEWNFKTGKPYRVSSDPDCRKRLYAQAEKNMKAARGVSVHDLLDDMEHQQDMLAHRHTSGDYVFKDGGKVGFASKLELSFLKFCDLVMEFTSNMIQVPPEIFTYHDDKENRDRQYIPDFYLPDYNLIVEIKDDGNGNPAFIKETKYKVAYKDAAMKKQKKYNYIRINGTNYGPFVEALYMIVHKQESDGKERQNLIYITEAACTSIDDVVDLTAPDIPTEDTPLVIIIGKMPGTDLHTFTAMTTSKHLSSWTVSDNIDQTISATNYQDPAFANNDHKAYKYVGKVPITESCILIQKLQESVCCRVWDILSILKENGIMFDDAHGVSNNSNREMMFTEIDLNDVIDGVISL